jgi:hypothetical protein
MININRKFNGFILSSKYRGYYRVFFLVFFLLGGIMKGTTEEVSGTILFKPTFRDSEINGGLAYKVILSTQDDFIEDRHMNIEYGNHTEKILDVLQRYVKKDGKIIFEDEGLRPFQNFDQKRMLAIITPEGQKIELTRLFTIDVIKVQFPYLYSKLVREGRVN